ncbi:MAG: GNAT family N-acetyltransferase [Bacteroidota bacterium]|nr:GNAT family N-acetyltransferase [Bacteroidota bacterium]
MLIKDASIKDLEVIHDLAHKIWPAAYSAILSQEQLRYMLEKIYALASLQHQVSQLKHHFIILLEEEIPIGFASFSPKKDGSKIFKLHKIYVLPQKQGSGSGKFLLNHVINSITEAGATSLELNVNRHNVAKSFYEKHGFSIKEEVDIPIGEGFFMNDYIMERVF